MVSKNEINALNESLKDLSPIEVLEYFIQNQKSSIALASSLGLEDQVLTDMICKIDNSTRIFTLDTGRLFPETYSLLSKTSLKYNINIKVYFPDTKQVEEMVNTKGINLFYDSAENRKECCDIRKIAPLKRAFKDVDAWICGLRKDQSVTRNNMQLVEWDDNNNALKINPLINWSEVDVWEYIKKNGVPYNLLHDKGFPSIGCRPCTRAVELGEDIRSGRWWWENPEQKECGLHKK